MSTKFKTFLGLYILAVSAAIGGNDNPLWMDKWPMSNMEQTLVLMIGAAVGAWLLSTVVADLKRV